MEIKLHKKIYMNMELKIKEEYFGLKVRNVINGHDIYCGFIEPSLYYRYYEIYPFIFETIEEDIKDIEE